MDYNFRSLIAHPFLLAIFPVIFSYSVNMHELVPKDIIFPSVLILSITFTIWVILRFILKSGRKAGLIISIALILFFTYGHIYNVVNDISVGDSDGGRHRYLIIPFFVCFVLSIYYFVRTKHELDNATTIANVIAVSFIAIILVNVTTYNVNENYVIPQKQHTNSIPDEDITKFTVSNPEKLPDVYYIILDEYAGPVGLEFLQYDNSDFFSYLDKREFYLPPDSHSNYSMTHFSLSSSMNMKYVNYLSDELGKESKNYIPATELLLNSEVIHNFKSLGYKIVIFDSGTLSSDDFKDVDVSMCKDTKPFNYVLLDAVARTSMIGYFIERWSEEDARNMILCVFTELPTVKDNYDEPIFVFAHIIFPHPPYIFGPNGEKVTPGNLYNSEKWDEKLAYLDQLKFANKKSSEVIDNLLENKEYQPIIILQSDHGLGFIDWKNPNNEMLKQRFSILNAYYLPDDGKDQLYERITPVNSFRLIFNVYFNGNYTILDDKMYWSNGKKPYDMHDVTDDVIQSSNDDISSCYLSNSNCILN